MGKQMQRSHRLVLVPCPYQGHINPMLQLGTYLHSKGFSITIFHTIFNSPNPHNHPNFSFLPLPDGLADLELSSLDLASTLLAINKNCKERFRRSLEQLIGEEKAKGTEGEIISCIISDELMFFAEDVASNVKLPSIILRTTSAATSFARSGLVKLKEDGRLHSHDTLSNELVPELYPLRFKDLPFSPAPNFEAFSAMVSKIYENRESSAIIWNTVNCLEQSTLEQIQQKCQVPIFPIGPLHMIATSYSSSLIKEDRSCLSWLDQQPHRSVIYVSSLGSIASLNENEGAEIAWGLANSKQPFLWVIRPGSVQGSNCIEFLPKGFEDVARDKGCIVRWAPQKEVLAHPAVGGFWSHCGWNSTLESIAEGVPMICKPCFGDQRVNARYVSHVWSIGLELEELERAEIARAVRRLMLDDEGMEMRKRAKELKEKFEVCTRKGGSSCDSLDKLVELIMSFA